MDDFNSLNYTIQDLPLSLEIDVSELADTSDLTEVKESLKSQILYASKQQMPDDDMPELSIVEFSRNKNRVKFNIHIAN